MLSTAVTLILIFDEQKALREPIVSCALGKLYNKDAVLEYLLDKANFVQVSPEVPITKQRNPDKVDAPDVFDGASCSSC